jgi:excisionase family DNA binding protein
MTNPRRSTHSTSRHRRPTRTREAGHPVDHVSRTPGATAHDDAFGTTRDEGDIVLYTPAQAAALLAVKESWLRRKAGQRAIPCTFLGKHLRFSTHDLRAITALGSQPVIAHRDASRQRRRGARPPNG